MSYYDIAILVLPIILLTLDERGKLNLTKLIVVDLVFVILLILHDRFDFNSATFLIGLSVFILANLSFSFKK